ncbi:MAG TPA: OsmC family protein [Candidatus Binatia bacterium]|nr:OsmC family protein [Candidatus Binatia bacterium]
MKQHTYRIRMEWTGNDGEGTKGYKSYRRDYTISVEGKPTILGSSDPNFRGDPSRYNPEELMVASLSSCHMLWFLHLCSVNQIVVVDYLDEAGGLMKENPDGSGEFVTVTLKPKVTIASGNPAKLDELHHKAHQLCFIARSVNFPVEIQPQAVAAELPA